MDHHPRQPEHTKSLGFAPSARKLPNPVSILYDPDLVGPKSATKMSEGVLCRWASASELRLDLVYKLPNRYTRTDAPVTAGWQ